MNDCKISVAKLLVAATARFDGKDKTLQCVQSIAEGLCDPERQHRLLLKDAHRKLKEHKSSDTLPAHKKAKIVQKESGFGVKPLSLGLPWTM